MPLQMRSVIIVGNFIIAEVEIIIVNQIYPRTKFGLMGALSAILLARRGQTVPRITRLGILHTPIHQCLVGLGGRSQENPGITFIKPVMLIGTL